MRELVRCIQSGGSAGVADSRRSGGGGWGGAGGSLTALHSPTEGGEGPEGLGSGAGLSGCSPGLNMPGAVSPPGGVDTAQRGALCGGDPGESGCSRAEGDTAGGDGGGGGGAPGSPDAGEARARWSVPGRCCAGVSCPRCVAGPCGTALWGASPRRSMGARAAGVAAGGWCGVPMARRGGAGGAGGGRRGHGAGAGPSCHRLPMRWISPASLAVKRCVGV